MRRLVLPLLTLGSNIPLRGQSLGSQLAPGTRVRITAPLALEERMIGTIVSLSPDTLVLLPSRDYAQQAVPVAVIRRLDVSRGHNRWGGALKGAGIGALVGPLTGLALGSLADSQAG